MNSTATIVIHDKQNPDGSYELGISISYDPEPTAEFASEPAKIARAITKAFEAVMDRRKDAKVAFDHVFNAKTGHSYITRRQ